MPTVASSSSSSLYRLIAPPVHLAAPAAAALSALLLLKVVFPVEGLLPARHHSGDDSRAVEMVMVASDRAPGVREGDGVDFSRKRTSEGGVEVGERGF
ncbi:hypothetical protein R1flu_016940 [Riccia fluitans]|uniref:Uncharacterized protein n=1 Tax=Riccia fluitans TaxID=41844 RepID=A0ABD1YN98_9MARC